MLGLLVALTGLVIYCNVDKKLNEEDKRYIRLYLPGVAEGSAIHASYAEQLRLIQLAKQAVADRTRSWMGIPEGQPREPKQLYLGRSGVCYDRSRTLEKIFLYLGFENRHLSMFMREPDVHSYTTLLLHHVPSHAISEVLTSHGWLMVDSNDFWLSLDERGEPVSMNKLQLRYLAGKPVKWKMPVLDIDNMFYNDRCIPIYGLYSRHGRFYPPYIHYIPDYRIRGLLYNFDDE